MARTRKTAADSRSHPVHGTESRRTRRATPLPCAPRLRVKRRFSRPCKQLAFLRPGAWQPFEFRGGKLLAVRGVVLIGGSWVLAAALASSAGSLESLDLSSSPAELDLVELLWTRSPELVAARAKLGLAEADVTRSEALPNPGFDFQWGTLALGPTNPPGLDKLRDVPNYVFTLNQPVELGKRGPRQSATRASRESALYDAIEALRQRWFDLLERISEVATAEIRVAALQDTVRDAQRLADLQLERQRRGDIAGLDVDRAVLEAEKYASSLGQEKEKLSATLLLCSQAAGVPCRPFGSAEAAHGFLTGRIAASLPAVNLDQRPDLRSLEAQEAAARSSLTLARNRWIPDPTFRMGYVLDQFTVSGNQHQSLFVGMSFPLPFFEHGQADAQAASALAEAAGQSRLLLRIASLRDLSSLEQQRADALGRRSRLLERTLPLARDVVQRLESAVTRGGAPLPDLLLARRTLGDLQLDAADLDLFAFHLTVAHARAAGELPPLPENLPHVP
jgi:outer membrane protein, heavy metal efflux system